MGKQVIKKASNIRSFFYLVSAASSMPPKLLNCIYIIFYHPQAVLLPDIPEPDQSHWKSRHLKR